MSFLILDSTSDDESIPEERIATPDREYNYPRDHLCNSRDKIKLPPQRDSDRRQPNSNIERRPQNLPPPVSYHNIYLYLNIVLKILTRSPKSVTNHFA